MEEIKVVVAVLKGKPFVNAIGSTEAEVLINLGFIELEEEDYPLLEFKAARLVFD